MRRIVMSSPSPIFERRRDQMFPLLTPRQVESARRFGGRPQTFEPNQLVIDFGQVGAPAYLVLSGDFEVRRRDGIGHTDHITKHGAGNMAGELTQLGAGPSYVSLRAGAEGCQAVPFDSVQFRALLIGDAELGEMLMRAFILRRVALLEAGAGAVLVGRADSYDSLRLQNFLRRNGVPHELLDPDKDAEARQILDSVSVTAESLPLALCPDGTRLCNPTEKQLARCLGLLPSFSQDRGYDVAIVGAGPAGLAAAVYAGSEGLSVVVLDSRAFGGQAGASARIENYLGFPTGVSGAALAGRAFNQAQKFGATFGIPLEARTLKCGLTCGGLAKLETMKGFGTRTPRSFELHLDEGERLRASAIVIASGARYRRLSVGNLSDFEGHGVYYWASPLEANLCARREVVLVGGGNSAGQAAVYLASKAAFVHMLVRGPNLHDSMSKYLIDRIQALPNVELHTQTDLLELKGTRETGLQSVVWRDRRNGQTEEHAIRHVFLFIGADPNTDWVKECDVATDGKGFILTGGDLQRALPLETNQPGIFAIGDVRAGSVKRVAAAVGEGAAVVAQLHSYLARESA
jgi:thioredoxin reductase (NADPH)